MTGHSSTHSTEQTAAAAAGVRQMLETVQAGDPTQPLTVAPSQVRRPLPGALGLTACHLAAACGSAKTISALVAAGCPLNAPLEADLDLQSPAEEGLPPPGLEPGQQQQQQEEEEQPPSVVGGSSSQHARQVAHASVSAEAGLRRRPSPYAVTGPGGPQAPAAAAHTLPRGLTGTAGALFRSFVSTLTGSRPGPDGAGAGTADGGPTGEAAAREQACALGAALPAGALHAFRKGATPLHVAAYLGREEAVAALLRAGTVVDPQDAEGFTPLHYSTGLAPGGQQAYWAAPSPAIAEMLVWAGADCLASHKGPFGRPTGSALSILHNLPYNPVLTNSQRLQLWDSAMDTLRRILTVLAETAASPKRSNRVHLPANDLECCQVVEAAARVGHLAAWRCFLAGAGLLEEGELPPRQQLQLGLSPQTDDPSNTFLLAEAGVDLSKLSCFEAGHYHHHAASGCPPLEFAAKRGHERTLEALLSLGVPPTQAALLACVKASPPQPAALRVLLAHAHLLPEDRRVEVWPQVLGYYGQEGRGEVGGCVLSWRCPVHALLQLHLSKATATWKKPTDAELGLWRTAAVQCMEALRDCGWERWVYDLAIPERYSNGSLLPPHLREAALAALAALPAEQELAMRDPLSDPATLDLEGCNRWLWLAFSGKAWARQDHWCYPPTFQAAARALLLAHQRAAGCSSQPAAVVAPAAGAEAGEEGCEAGAGAAAAGLGSLPGEVVLHVLRLASRPLSAWL